MANLLPIKVSDDLEHKIREGILAEGEKLSSERIMAENYQVSRNVVREAFKILKEKGIIEIITGKGAYVTVPKPEELQNKFEKAVDFSDINIEELLEARLEIELVVAKRVIEKITPEQMLALKERYTSLQENICDRSQFLILDADFHLFIAQCTNNKVLVLITSTLNNLTDRKSYFDKNDMKMMIRAQEEHNEMIKAIENKDLEHYKQAVIRHLECIRTHIRGK